MKLLLSGEGPTDIGTEAWDGERQVFQPGPMARMVDSLCEQRIGYSLLDPPAVRAGYVRFVHKQELQNRLTRRVLLPGRKRATASLYHFESARSLGALAISELDAGPVVAILFRDSDGTQTAPRHDWQDKVQSILDGFAAAEFPRGVPMVPKPKGEAWMLCGLKEHPYQGCAALEDLSGNDASPNSLKAQLAQRLGMVGTAEAQADAVIDGRVDPLRIDMPSFNRFRNTLLDALAAVLRL
jgi:hypothetical protein